MEIILVRHGESEANVDRLYYGSMDFSLTEKGKEEASKAGKLLKSMDFIPDFKYTSRLTRTHQTLENMGFSLEKSFEDKRLNERALGELEGFTKKQILKKDPTLFKKWDEEWYDFAPGGGENLIKFTHRVASFMDDLAEKHEKGDKILIVSHAGTMKSIMSYILGNHRTIFENMMISNCSIIRLKQNTRGFYFDALYNIDDFSF